MQRLLHARITHLEMTSPPSRRVAAPSGPKLAVMVAEQIPLHFYRYLYEQVGRAHHWTLRRNLSDEALGAQIHGADTEIQIIYCDGSPAGFFELDLSDKSAAIEIRYFGLVRDFQGRGLARFFLFCALERAWSLEPRKVIIQTNTLDSPRALQLYQKAGFQPVSWSEEDIPVWE